MKVIGVSLLLAILCSVSAVVAYERYVVAPQFAELQRVLFDGSDTIADAPSNTCPAGSYAVGIRTVSVSGGAHGFLESATIRCMELKFKKK